MKIPIQKTLLIFNIFLTISTSLFARECRIKCMGIMRTLPPMFCTRLLSLQEALLVDGYCTKYDVGNNSMILSGPSGAGKTTLAQAFAKEAGYDFECYHASSLVNQFQGSGPKAIKDIFERVIASGKPTVLFFDEIDAIGDISKGEHNNKEREVSYQELNAQLDRIRGNSKIFVIFATNYLERCAFEFVDRCTRIKVDAISLGDKKELVSYLFSNLLKFELERKNISLICAKVIDGYQLKFNENNLILFEKLVIEINDSLPKINLSSSSNILQDLKNKVISLKAILNEAKKNNPDIICKEANILNVLIKKAELQINVFEFLKNSNFIDYIVNNTENMPLRFLAYYVKDVLKKAEIFDSGSLSKESMIAFLNEAKLAYAQAKNDNEFYKHWDNRIDSMDLMNKQFLLALMTPVVSTAMGVAGAAATNIIMADPAGTGISTIAQNWITAHPYWTVTGGVVIIAGTAVGGYYAYKWFTTPKEK